MDGWMDCGGVVLPTAMLCVRRPSPTPSAPLSFASLWVHNRTLGYVCERQQESEMALYHVSAQTRSEEY